MSLARPCPRASRRHSDDQSSCSDCIEPAVNIVFGALGLVLLVKYRDKGILRRICESKYRFRTRRKSIAK
jgi:hypothetical protein